jgi:hypothetical protein
MDLEFLELARVLDATLGRYNHPGLVNGKTGQKVLQFLASCGCFDLSSELQERVSRCLQDDAANVRATLKDVYMFPRRLNDYPPWEPLVGIGTSIDFPVLAHIPDARFQLQVYDHKIYAVQVEGENAAETLCGFVFGHDKSMSPPTGPVHVTVVNSDVLALLDPEQYQPLLARFQSPFPVEIKDIKSTVDYVVFSRCVVAIVTCPEIEEFLLQFSLLFEEPVRSTVRSKSLHLTFAQKPRALQFQKE